MMRSYAVSGEDDYLEFDLIERIRRRAGQRNDVVLGIGDDAALLQPPPGQQLVVATDTLNAGIHFPRDTTAADIGWKALAVNLSDLAAMAAQPAWCTLALCLPEPDTAWLDGFLDGFLELADQHGIALVGGDTTHGPLSVCVTAIGLVEAGRALRRGGARVGDDVWVSGHLGDAAAALAALQTEPVVASACEAAPILPAEAAGNAGLAVLRQRLDRPTPRVALGRRLAGMASAAIDVSDGLLADLGHVCYASGVAAEVQLDALPASPALRSACIDAEQRHVLQATGGDDYELCFTAAAGQDDALAAITRDTGVAMTRIGRITTGKGVRVLRSDGSQWQPPRSGYRHFT